MVVWIMCNSFVTHRIVQQYFIPNKKKIKEEKKSRRRKYFVLFAFTRKIERLFVLIDHLSMLKRCHSMWKHLDPNWKHIFSLNNHDFRIIRLTINANSKNILWFVCINETIGFRYAWMRMIASIVIFIIISYKFVLLLVLDYYCYYYLLLLLMVIAWNCFKQIIRYPTSYNKLEISNRNSCIRENSGARSHPAFKPDPDSSGWKISEKESGLIHSAKRIYRSGRTFFWKCCPGRIGFG